MANPNQLSMNFPQLLKYLKQHLHLDKANIPYQLHKSMDSLWGNFHHTDLQHITYNHSFIVLLLNSPVKEGNTFKIGTKSSLMNFKVGYVNPWTFLRIILEVGTWTFKTTYMIKNKMMNIKMIYMRVRQIIWALVTSLVRFEQFFFRNSVKLCWTIFRISSSERPSDLALSFKLVTSFWYFLSSSCFDIFT